MCSFDGVVVCSNLPCWNLLYIAGVFENTYGDTCGVCAVHEEHDDRLRKHAAQFALLASVRSTSQFLVLFRSGTLLRQHLADISVGTLAAATQEYLVRLKRRNLRMLLTVSDGFTVFLRLCRRWMGGVVLVYGTNQDCLDYLLDFLLPSDELRG